MRFQTLQWLFPVVAALHNGEEAIWLPRWSQHAVPWYPPIEPGVFRFAALVLTLLAIVFTYLSFRAGKQSIGAYLTFGYMVATLGNVLVPHVGLSVAFHTYMPGLATAVLLNLPVLTFLVRLALKDGYVSGWKATTYSLAVPAFLLLTIRPLFALARILGF